MHTYVQAHEKGGGVNTTCCEDLGAQWMGVQGRLCIYLLPDVFLHQLCLIFVLLNQESKIKLKLPGGSRGQNGKKKREVFLFRVPLKIMFFSFIFKYIFNFTKNLCICFLCKAQKFKNLDKPKVLFNHTN